MVMEVMVSEDLRSQVHAAVRALAECSSDAPNAGQTGFHRLDVTFGRELAATEQLDLGEVVVAARLLHRYQRQLGAIGVTLPDEATIINWAVEQEESISEEEQAMSLELAHLPEPPSISPTIEPPEASPEANDVSPQSQKPPVAKRVYLQGGRIFVEFPYDSAKVNAIRPLKESVEDWAFNRFKRDEWSYPQIAALSVYEAIRGFEGFTYSREVVDLLKRTYRKQALVTVAQEIELRWHELSQYAALEAAQPYLDGAPTVNGQRLFRHQREAVQRMIEAQRFILAHQMGLGKTKAALIAAQAYDLPIWVIVPAGTIINWQREATAAGVEITLYSWAKLPEPPEHLDYVLIVDEAHYAQGGEDTIRGKGFLRLADEARAVFMLTGTPLKNSLPINLWPLLVAARHPLATDRSAYVRLYCEGHYRSIGRKRSVYDTSGASNLDELHERIRDVVLYKKKSECIDLPDKLRMPRLAEVSTAGELAYRKTIERLRQEHLERMADKYEVLRAGREDLLGEGIEESDLGEFESEYASALVELGIYRHAASLAKVESAAEIAQEAIEQGQGVLLFTAFRDTAERLATKLDADCLTGEVTGKRRQDMIDRFQAEEKKVLVATIGAGGIGHNLTAAQVVIMVDRPWTPGDTEQAEDRAHRLGQIHNVLSLWLQYGPIDDKIDQLLELKQERIEMILRGRGKNLRGVPGIRALAKEIMESVHTGKSLAEILGLDPAEFEHQAVDLVRDDVLPAPRPVPVGGKRDGRLKGDVPRIRANVRMDPEVLAFLRSIKASKQQAAKEPGYSGFLEDLVRSTPQFASWRTRRRQS
jgi:Helicase conserved C-terminal domain